MDGMELLRRLREFSSVPVIFLTSKDDELDEALGLAMGADDYIAKPFSPAAADRPHPRDPAPAGARARRGGGDKRPEAEPPRLERGRLVMDPARHKVTVGRHVTSA